MKDAVFLYPEITGGGQMKNDKHLMRLLAYLQPYIREFIPAGVMLSILVIIGFLQPLII